MIIQSYIGDIGIVQIGLDIIHKSGTWYAWKCIYVYICPIFTACAGILDIPIVCTCEDDILIYRRF